MSNYPDIELPFFDTSRKSMIYFIVQMTVGIFLLSNLLLATVFNNYKTMLDRKMPDYCVERYLKEDGTRGVKVMFLEKKRFGTKIY